MIGANYSQDIFLLFAYGAALILFWFLETIWRNEKRGLIFVLLFPPSILFYIYKYWDEMRGKCFFAALYAVVLILVNAVTQNDFTAHIGRLLQLVAFWPYYLYLQFTAQV